MLTLTEKQISEFDDIMKQVGALVPGIKSLSEAEGGFAAIKNLPAALKAEQNRFDELQAEVKKLTKAQQFPKRSSDLSHSGVRPTVTDDCAKYLGILALGAGVKHELIKGKNLDMVEGLYRDFIGVELKTALSTSDIPLPVEYSGQVVKLVGMYGTARRFGTVYPLGAASVKLPKLGTDTRFTINAISASITEKSPSFSNVTFTAEKFGGLVRIPTEIEEDSIVNMGQFIADYGARQTAWCEDTQFWISDKSAATYYGTAPGLTVATIDNSKTYQLGSTKTHYTDMTLASLRELRGIPDSSALRKGAYYFHPSFENALSAMNTASDRPYNPNAQLANAGAQPFMSGPTFDGFPVYWIDVLPVRSNSANASTVFALFGDASYHYLGIRGGVRFDSSRDAAFATDEILIRILERMTTGLMATGAMAGLETAAS